MGILSSIWAVLTWFLTKPFLKVNLQKKVQSLGAQGVSTFLIKRLFKKTYTGILFIFPTKRANESSVKQSSHWLVLHITLRFRLNADRRYPAFCV